MTSSDALVTSKANAKQSVSKRNTSQKEFATVITNMNREISNLIFKKKMTNSQASRIDKKIVEIKNDVEKKLKEESKLFSSKCDDVYYENSGSTESAKRKMAIAMDKEIIKTNNKVGKIYTDAIADLCTLIKKD